MFKELLYFTLIGIVLGAQPPNSKLNRKTNYKRDDRIPANIADFPWQVSIIVDPSSYNYHCDGFLVAPNWVLTTAKCASVAYAGPTFIRASSNYTLSGGEVYNISKYIVHPGFNLSAFDNNIGLFKLSTPVNTSDARLPEAGQSIPDNASLLVTGYNNIFKKDNALLQVTTPTFDHDTCKDIYDNEWGVLEHKAITENSFCIGELDIGDHCYGNEGSPAYLDGKIVGIVGIIALHECSVGYYPTVVTKVSNYIDWINQYVQE